MNLKQNYLTESGCYKAGKRITVKGLMIHSVGCPQPKAEVFMKNWNRAEASACVHAIVEPDGDVYQILPWNHRGWHCGGGANNTHIGVEMTEPATIRYTGGSKWTETGDGENTKNHVLATYKYAVELFAYLCSQYNLDPLADGVVISHSEGCRRGIASNHGDVEHLWSKFGLSMEQFRKDIKAAMEGGSAADSLTAIMGKAKAAADQMKAYLKKKNPAVPQSVLDMIPLYISEGEAEGVRGDIAFAQSCLETGNFTFSGSAVTLPQNNFCGLGVTQRGKTGLSFDTPQLGMQYGDVKPATEADVSGKLENLQRLMEQPPVPEDGEFSEEDIDKYVFGVRVYEDRFEWLLNLSPEARGELDDAGSPVYFTKLTVTPDDERAWFRMHPQWSKSNKYAELEAWIYI